MKSRIDLPVEEPVRGKRGRKHRDEDAPKTEDPKPQKWREREGYFQGAKVTRRG